MREQCFFFLSLSFFLFLFFSSTKDDDSLSLVVVVAVVLLSPRPLLRLAPVRSHTAFLARFSIFNSNNAMVYLPLKKILSWCLDFVWLFDFFPIFRLFCF